MRVFWALIGVLVLATVGLLVAKSAGGSAVVDGPAAPEPADRPMREPVAPIAATEPGIDDEAAIVTGGDVVDEPEAGVEGVEAERVADGAPGEVEIVEASESDDAAIGGETPADAEAIAGTGEDVIPPIDEVLDIQVEEVVEAAPEKTADAPAEEIADAPEAEVVEQPTARGDPLAGLDLGLAAPEKTDAEAASETRAPVAAPAIVEREDGTLLVNERFVVRGEGTRERPYEMGLDLLVSVQDAYNPRAGKEEVPAWLSRFEGAWVRITGNWLFPLWAEETDELLLMKNQWDGCCIGVPPTPYDAVEVKLASPVDLSRVGEAFGAVEGRFKVEPYIRSKWLLGLYVMEEGRLSDG